MTYISTYPHTSWLLEDCPCYARAVLKISKLKSPRNIIKASGAKLDIVGHCEFYIKVSVLGKSKKVNCLVLRGNIIDREILISGKMLKAWRMIHPTFPNESVETYINKLCSNDSHVLDSNKIYAIYEKSLITIKEYSRSPTGGTPYVTKFTRVKFTFYIFKLNNICMYRINIPNFDNKC